MAESIQIQQDKYTLLFKSLAWILIAFQVILIAATWGQIDETIATHFNVRGEADHYGSKIVLWLIPGINMVLNLFIFELAKYPKMFNYPVRIDESNQDYQYQLAYKSLMAVCAGTSALFTVIAWDMIRTALTGNNIHSVWILLEIFAFIIAPIIVYVYLAKKKPVVE